MYDYYNKAHYDKVYGKFNGSVLITANETLAKEFCEFLNLMVEENPDLLQHRLFEIITHGNQTVIDAIIAKKQTVHEVIEITPQEFNQSVLSSNEFTLFDFYYPDGLESPMDPPDDRNVNNKQYVQYVQKVHTKEFDKDIVNIGARQTASGIVSIIRKKFGKTIM